MAPRSKSNTLGARRMVLAVLLAALGASACSRSKAIPSAKPHSENYPSSGTVIKHERPRPGELHVLVVDGSGAPLSGVSVIGDYKMNATPMPSTCCSTEDLGEEMTGRDGVAVLHAPPLEFRSAKITATRPGWPPQAVSISRYGVGPRTDAWGRIVIMLGPPREIRGRVDMGADCPPGFVEVSGALPQVSALVDGEGQFILRGLSPSTVSVGFSACGRNAGASVEPGASSPLVLALPPRKPGQWPFDVASAVPAGTASPPPSSHSVRLPCLQPSGELVAAGDFDSIALDAQCRFVLAGKRATAGRYDSSHWTLLRPDGTRVPIGESLRGIPDIGDNVVYLSAPGEETAEIVDFVRGTREVVLPPARFLPAAHDATVLARPAITQAGSQAQTLELRWYDGTRKKLPGPIATWSLIRNRSAVVYCVVPGKRSVVDVHWFDLETRIDHLVAKGVLRAFDLDDGRALLIHDTNQLIVYDIERKTRDVLQGSGDRWHVFSPELALRTETDGSASLRKPNVTLPVAFRWPKNAHERRLNERYLFFGVEGDAVLVDTVNGAPRALASGVQVSEYLSPPVSGDLVALSESSGRALVATLSGKPLRAVGRGTPRTFSPDGRWLTIVREIEDEIQLAPVAGEGKLVTLQGWGGSFAQDAPALFFYTGKGAYDQPRPLYVTYAALGRTLELEPSVLDYALLQGGEVLAVVPPGGKRAPGIYRRAAPPQRSLAPWACATR